MNNDLISRSELKKAVNDFFDNHFKGLVSNELITYAKAVDNAIDNAPTVELFCSYLSDEEVRQPCIEAPCKHERPQTIDCTNCKHESKRLIDEPCKYCNIKYSEWEKKGGKEE